MRLGAIHRVEALVASAAERYARDGNARAALVAYDTVLVVLRTIPAAPGSRVDEARQRAIANCLQHRAEALHASDTPPSVS